jgi:hypothetical protein
MDIRGHDAPARRRERLWNWTFWMSIVASEALGVFLTHQS